MKTKLLFVLLTALFLGACNENQEGTTYNENIDAELRSKISALNERVAHAITHGKPNELRGLMSEPLLKTIDGSFSQFVEYAAQYMSSSELLDVGHAHHIQKDTSEGIVLSFDTTSESAFEIRYKAITNESYASVVVPERDGDLFLLSCIYGLFDGQWKLNAIQFGRLEVQGMNAIEHYRQAQSDYENGLLIPAVSRMSVASACIRPGNGFWRYKLEPEIESFNAKILKEANQQYTMPYTISQMETAPEVFSLGPNRMGNEICTMIKYRSSINIEDTLALAAENKALHELAPKIYPGIDHESSFIFYRAFNEIPVEEVATPYFGFVRKVESDETSILK